MEEWQGKKGGKKDKKEKRTGTCVEEKKRGKKKCRVWRIKKEGKKKEKKKRRREEILSVRLLLVNIGEKKIIFLEREKNNFNSTFKLKSVSIFIIIFSQYFHNKS